MIIREDIDRLDDAAPDPDNEQAQDLVNYGNNSESEETPVEYIAHISVGSALKPVSIADIEASHSNDSAFQSFRTKLVDSLEFILAEATNEYKHVRINRDHQVRIQFCRFVPCLEFS
jgi:hypothetical protein